MATKKELEQQLAEYESIDRETLALSRIVHELSNWNPRRPDRYAMALLSMEPTPDKRAIARVLQAAAARFGIDLTERTAPVVNVKVNGENYDA